MLLGQILPNGGSIRVLGEVPGESDIVPGSSVGYAPQVRCVIATCPDTPQEIALYPELSVEEMLHFHGRLHRMDHEYFLQRKA